MKVPRLGIKEILIVFFIFVVAVNFVYFNYIYIEISNKKAQLIKRCTSYKSRISDDLRKVNRDMSIFGKIVAVKKKIAFYKKRISLLKRSRVTVFDVSKILKDLLVESRVNVVAFTFDGLKKTKNRVVYSFSVRLKDSLPEIVHFMDVVEGYSEHMYIPSYSLNTKRGVIFSASLTVNYAQMVEK